MARNQFSSYGRTSRPLPQGNGKSFYCLASASTLIPDVQLMNPVDEDGVPRVFSGDTAIGDAMAYCTAGRGDTIYVFPGTYTISTAIAASVAGVRIQGFGAQGAAVLTGSAANIINITGNGVEIMGLTMNLASTKMAISMNGVQNCHIHDNVFLSAVGGAASHFINMNTAACNYNRIVDNRFISNLVVAGGAITQTSHITGLGIGNIIEHNTFVAGRVTTANTGTVTNGVVFSSATDMGNLVRWNSFSEANGGIFTAGVNYGTTAVQGAVLNYSNNFYLATAANAVVNGANSDGFDSNVANGTV